MLRNLPVVADDGGGSNHGLGDGARAVGDGEGGSLGDGVGLATVGDLGSGRAVGGVHINDLGDVRDVGVGRDTSDGGENGGSSELHLD